MTFSNLFDNYCDKMEPVDPEYCGGRWKIQHSAGNTDLTLITYEKLLTLAAFFGFLLMRIVFFREARMKESQLDAQISTPGDYTIMITGMPRDVTEKEVRKHFENYPLDGRLAQVYRVNFAYYIGDFIEIAREKNEALKKIFKEKRKDAPRLTHIQALEVKVKNFDEKMRVLKRKYMHLKHRKTELFTGTCFVTFNIMKDKADMYNKWKINFLGRASLKYCKCLQRCYTTENERFRGKSVIVKEPPEPSDILWENLGTPFGTLVKTRLVTILLTILILIASFFTILGLKYAQRALVKKTKGFVRTLLSLTITLVLLGVDIILGIVLRSISSYEKYSTLTGYNSGVARRVATVRESNLFFFQGNLAEHLSYHCSCKLADPRKRHEESDVE